MSREPVVEKSRKIGPITVYKRTEEGKRKRAERRAAGTKPKKRKRLPEGKTAGYPMSYLSSKGTKKKYLDKALGLEYEME